MRLSRAHYHGSYDAVVSMSSVGYDNASQDRCLYEGSGGLGSFVNHCPLSAILYVDL